jgi:hypothetical protein
MTDLHDLVTDLFPRGLEPHFSRWMNDLTAHQLVEKADIAMVLALQTAEIWRLRSALDRIAATTGSDDPCRPLVQIARDTLDVPALY